MLQVAENLRPIDGRVEGHYDSLDGWSPMPVRPSTRQLRLYLGDPQSGPMVWLFNGAPFETPAGQARPESLPAPPHLHRSPTFRVSLGDQPRQVLFDGVWLKSGDYMLLEANKVYSDPGGVDGYKTLLVFADRRGMHPAMQVTASMTSDEMIAWNANLFGAFGEGLACVHTENEEATVGAAITTRKQLQHGGRAKGSIDDPDDWSALTDGSRIAAAFMGDPVGGPVVIMSRNAANVLESPAGLCGTDMFRVITKGSCSIGGRTYKAGAFLASEAGTPLGEVVHGPEGSTQVVIASDRRHWAPLDRAGAPVTCARLDEISAVLTPFIAEPSRSH